MKQSIFVPEFNNFNKKSIADMTKITDLINYSGDSIAQLLQFLNDFYASKNFKCDIQLLLKLTTLLTFYKISVKSPFGKGHRKKAPKSAHLQKLLRRAAKAKKNRK